jgi:hypothetical protein
MTQLDARVVIDEEGIKLYSGDGTADPGLERFLQPLLKTFTGMFSGDEGPINVGGYHDIYVQYDKYPADKEFSSIQLQLCPSTIIGCTLDSKKWFELSLNHLQEVKWEKAAFTNLVLDQGTKDLIQGLVENHKRNSGKVTGDFIEGKGKVRS